MTEEGKRCTRCKGWKPWDRFAKQSRASDGKQSWCKDCNREVWALSSSRVSDYRRKNRNRLTQRQRIYRAANPERKRASDRRRAALKRSLPGEFVNIRTVALRDGAHCWMCGDELSEFNPSHMDHLIPLSATVEELEGWNVENPGTVAANMSLACPTCNMRKNNRVMLCALARYLRNLSADYPESELVA